MSWVNRQVSEIQAGGRHVLARKLRSASAIMRVTIIAFLVSPIAIILRLCGIRFSNGGTDNRVGHLIVEQLYMELLRKQGQRLHRRFVLLIPTGCAANDYVLETLPDSFTVIRSEFLCTVLSPFQRHPLTRVDMKAAVATSTTAARFFSYTHLIDASEPFLSVPRLPDAEVSRLLNALGLDVDRWYVCLHNREVGYSTADDDDHDFRNGTIDNFASVINFVTSIGGAVVRMGDPSVSRIAESRHVVDYAHSDLRSPKNDLILSANCRFFLGSSSGALAMAACQGVPVVAVNMAPMGACRVWGPKDIAVPKLYRWVDSGEYIAFAQVFNSELADIRYSSGFRDRGVYLQDNSGDEILEAVSEMVLRLDGEYAETPLDDALQQEFLSLFQPNNYSYWSKTRISAHFLRKHAGLLDSSWVNGGAGWDS